MREFRPAADSPRPAGSDGAETPRRAHRGRPWAACIGLALVCLAAWTGPLPAEEPVTLTVERIFGTPSLISRLPTDIRWVGDGKGVSYVTETDGDPGSALVVREVPSGKTRVLCLADTVTIPDDLLDADTDEVTFAGYRWNRQGSLIVFSIGDDLFTLERKSGRIERRTHTEAEEQDPNFSPDGKQLAYTRDNDLYTLDLESGEEARLTMTGSDTVLNGILDWVYMEELFTRGNVRAFWWSPDSERIVFLEIREHPVPEFPLVDWSTVHGSYELQRYPKAGDPAPIVRVGVVGAGGGDVVWAETDTSDDSYIARVYWLGDSRSVAIEKINRDQDELTLLFASARSGSLEEVFRESHTTWVNINYLKHYYEKKRRFIWGSERDGHSHLYLFNLDGSLIRQVTSGDWEVTDLDGLNESKGKIYFTANEGDILQRHLYQVSEKGGKLRRITSREGDHSVTMSPNHKYYIDRYSSHERPVRVSVHSINGKELFVIGDRMSAELASLERPVPEYLTFQTDGRTYHCSMIRPAGFDPGRKYPVIVYVYGGPHVQVVRKAWSRHGLWHSMMAQKGYIVFSLDNRGSFGRGREWEDPLLRRLGQVELEDQVAGVEYLRSLPYVDGENIGMWGWSYGGYMTLMAMCRAGDAFKAGAVVSPVSDWRLYDVIYTERYMKQPDENEEGYREGSPIHFVEDLRGALLLMHGGADDNVHTQNSIQLVRALVDAGKEFEFMVYPGRRHSIRGHADRTDLYNRMTRFFDRHLKGEG